MKPWIEESQRARAVANIVAGCAIVLFAVLVYQFGELMGFLSRLFRILAPFAMGFVVAFLLNPAQMWLEQQCHKLFDRFFKRHKPPKRLYRVTTTIVLYAAFVLLIIGFLSVVLPQLVGSIRTLIAAVSRYLAAHEADIQRFLAEFNLSGADGGNSFYNSLLSIWNDFASMSLSFTGRLVAGIVSVSASVSSLLSDIFIGLVVSIYMLFGKERFSAQAKKLGCAFTSRERVDRLSFWFRKTEHIFSGYIVGQILSCVLIGVLCYIFMLIFRMDFALLISVLIGVTNIIPVFGPVVGCIAGTLILLILNPMNALIFAIGILIMQQIDGNIIAPRIMGDSIGISSFWIMLSIVVGGGLFGVAGVLLSIPVFAVIYALIQSIAEEQLVKKGLPAKTGAYMEDLPSPKPKPTPPPTKESKKG